MARMTSDDDRRHFLGRLGGVAALGLVAGCGKQADDDAVAPPMDQLGDPAVDAAGVQPINTGLTPDPNTAAAGPVNAGPFDELPDGQGKPLEVGGQKVIVIREGDAVTAFDAKCTHKGCIVAWNAEQKSFDCPCHKSVYDATGTPTAGPAKTPLSSVPAKVEGGQIMVG